MKKSTIPLGLSLLLFATTSITHIAMATQQSEKIFVDITKECIRSKPIRIKNDVDKKYKNNLCAVYLPSIGQEDMALSILMAKKYYMNQPTRIPSLKQLALTKVVDTCNEHDFPKTNILCVPVVTKGKNKNAYNVIGSSYTITMSGKDVIELINGIKNGEFYTISNEVSIMKGGKEKRNYKVIASFIGICAYSMIAGLSKLCTITPF